MLLPLHDQTRIRLDLGKVDRMIESRLVGHDTTGFETAASADHTLAWQSSSLVASSWHKTTEDD